MKLITKEDMITIGIKSEKIIEFSGSPVMLLNNQSITTSSLFVAKLEDLFNYDWVNDINNGDAGLFLIYSNSKYDILSNAMTKETNSKLHSGFVLRYFS